jgi:hypothetical protein
MAQNKKPKKNRNRTFKLDYTDRDTLISVVSKTPEDGKSNYLHVFRVSKVLDALDQPEHQEFRDNQRKELQEKAKAWNALPAPEKALTPQPVLTEEEQRGEERGFKIPKALVGFVKDQLRGLDTWSTDPRHIKSIISLFEKFDIEPNLDDFESDEEGDEDEEE